MAPEQLDGATLSAHAAVMPAPESAAAMDATAIALAVRPLRNISGPLPCNGRTGPIDIETVWTLLG